MRATLSATAPTRRRVPAAAAFSVVVNPGDSSVPVAAAEAGIVAAAAAADDTAPAVEFLRICGSCPMPSPSEGEAAPKKGTNWSIQLSTTLLLPLLEALAAAAEEIGLDGSAALEKPAATAEAIASAVPAAEAGTVGASAPPLSGEEPPTCDGGRDREGSRRPCACGSLPPPRTPRSSLTSPILPAG